MGKRESSLGGFAVFVLRVVLGAFFVGVFLVEGESAVSDASRLFIAGKRFFLEVAREFDTAFRFFAEGECFIRPAELRIEARR